MLTLNELAPLRSSVPTLAVLISGSGRTLANLIAAIDQGKLRARIGTVISSAAGVRGLDIAAAANIPSAVLRRKDFDSDDAFSAAVYNALAPIEPDLIVMAGFLRRLVVTPAWEGRILNIHPALLPEMASAAGKGFYGNRVHAAVLAAGATISGATVHVVDNDYDSGPVVMKAKVPVLSDDTPESLAARVFEAECRLYPQAISSYLDQLRPAESTTLPRCRSGD